VRVLIQGIHRRNHAPSALEFVILASLCNTPVARWHSVFGCSKTLRRSVISIDPQHVLRVAMARRRSCRQRVGRRARTTSQEDKKCGDKQGGGRTIAEELQGSVDPVVPYALLLAP
jgi:hypothetical protein